MLTPPREAQACFSCRWQAGIWNMIPPYFMADCTEQLRGLLSHKDASQTLRFLIRSSAKACRNWWLQTHCFLVQCCLCVSDSRHLSKCKKCTPRHCANADSVQQQKTRFAILILLNCCLCFREPGGTLTGQYCSEFRLSLRCHSHVIFCLLKSLDGELLGGEKSQVKIKLT